MVNPRLFVAMAAIALATLAGCGGSQLPIAMHAFTPAQRTLNETSSSSYKVLYFFGGKSDGIGPAAPLVDVNGTLYGTTDSGGSFGNGTVYSISLSGAENVLYSFGAAPDGASPEAGLIDVNGTIYGTTLSGGSSNKGTVYSISTSGTETVLYSFAGGSDGAYPEAPLIDVKGTLYGTTLRGGGTGCAGLGCGTVFSISPSGTESVLYAFNGGSDGANPLAGVIDAGGVLYGTTALGGNSACLKGRGCGTVYRVTTKGAEKVLYRFAGGSDGQGPQSGLVEAAGKLYGTTAFGGGTECTAELRGHGKGCGTFYRVGTTGSEKVLFRFDTDAGTVPASGLVDVKGILYGTTYAGGSGRACGMPEGCGVVYSVTTSGTQKVLHSFLRDGDGARPLASLIDVDGTLYGTTSDGRKPRKNYGEGTVFALTP